MLQQPHLSPPTRHMQTTHMHSSFLRFLHWLFTSNLLDAAPQSGQMAPASGTSADASERCHVTVPTSSRHTVNFPCAPLVPCS